MRQIVFAALAAFSAFALPACTTTAPYIARDKVMDVARRVAADYAAAWNANDMAHFGALYAVDARHVTLTGDFLRGRPAIVAAYQSNRARYSNNVRMVTRLEGARAITNDAIVAVVTLEYVNDQSAPNGIQSTHLTLTLTHQHNQWLIAQAQSSPNS